MLKILVTNDDGIHALGIKTLVESICDWATIYISAPSEERSAVGHGITVRQPLMAEEFDFYGMKQVKAWSVNGNPADCVKLALHVLLDEKPDLVLSGINAGLNLGKDIYYSGTVSAAREGVIHGIPSIALSYDNHFHPQDFGEVTEILKPWLRKVKPMKIPSDVFLNVNVPHVKTYELKGIIPVPLDLHHYSDQIDRKPSEKGDEFWIQRNYDRKLMEQSDRDMLSKGYVTVTPVHIDATDTLFMQELRNWSWGERDE
ncbi:5'/3'-nucleotidase SurE [Ammoniphilus sp. CFH 90114]|uniref:5'/3'-nucleotidase SurE n=1 Tax=Ammoniphilus sp. CFH 90114 TaxID=2493665 RepID=UPI00100DBBAD|nr:5'/3'-nucleotidase SurE [Ammoniphilus sp. CFH 90114]RXT14955.1 5'/3'-nucleotidase SurE [Ammoniphilus sp. CFH 90114]